MNKKYLLIIFAVTLLLCGISYPTKSLAAISLAEPTANFEGSPCPFDVPEGMTVACGFVSVPEDHNNPAGPTIRIVVAVIKDQSEGHYPDPVMLLSGGPGEKTVQNVPGMTQILAPIHPNRDLIPHPSQPRSNPLRPARGWSI